MEKMPPQIFESEYRFCLLLWDSEPISSKNLVQLCAEKLGWSKSTTFTVIRRLSDRGVVKNENSIVTTLVSKQEVQHHRLETMVEETFEGSMPAFIAAFSRSKRLTKQELGQLRSLLENFEEEH